MRINISDIKKQDWLVACLQKTAWGKEFLSLLSGYHFVFYYNQVPDKSGINVVKSKMLYEINDGIYRDFRAEHVGYIREPFSTSNYLLYSLLESSIESERDREKLQKLFISYKAEDIAESKKNLKTKIKGNFEINSRISFSSALSNVFSTDESPVHGLCMIYDLIDQYTQRTFNKSIYGGYLTNIVKAFKNPNGGLLTEKVGSSIRYLIVGEVAAGNDPMLRTAKDLYRAGNSPRSVFLETGWFFNKYDFKWRKRISDDTCKIEVDKLTLSGNKAYLIPKGMKADIDKFEAFIVDFITGKKNINNIILDGYDARISDCVSFEDAFLHYPEMKELIALFAIGIPANFEPIM
jgi:hypothetical protein